MPSVSKSRLPYFSLHTRILISLDTMGKFTAYYWRHICPAESPEDGDVIYQGDDDVYHYDKIDLVERNFKDVSKLEGRGVP